MTDFQSTDVLHISNRPKLFTSLPTVKSKPAKTPSDKTLDSFEYSHEYSNGYSHGYSNGYSNAYSHEYIHDLTRGKALDSEVSSQRTVFSKERAKSETTLVASTNYEQDDSDILSALDAPDRLRILPRSSHRFGAQAASVTALGCLILNVAATIWLGTHPDPQSGLVTIFIGDCKQVSKMTTGIHFVINALSTVLLAGSNYCMQCLCGPTRQDIDRRHRLGKYLDIGTPSIRNLGTIASHKTLLWLILLLSSLPIHLLYNSSFYSSIAVQNYNIYVVTDSFLSGPAISMNNVVTYCNRTQDCFGGNSAVLDDLTRAQNNIKGNGNETWEELSPYDCIRAYAQPLLTNRRELVIITNSTNANNTFLNFDTYNHEVLVAGTPPFDWICSAQFGSRNYYGSNLATCESLVPKLEDTPNGWIPFHYKADRCFSRIVPEKCSFNGNIVILIVVIVCNAIKALIMLFVAYRLQGKPILNLGDAIQSFLYDPDPTTKGLSWLSKSAIIRQQQKSRATLRSHPKRLWPRLESDDRSNGTGPVKGVGRTIRLKSYRWYRAAGISRWLITLGLLALAILIVTVLLIMARLAYEEKSTGTKVFSTGFGRLTPLTVIQGWGLERITDPGRLLAAITLISNCPQFILSFIYFYINGLITVMYTANEWSDFAKKRKYLRVSSPRGNQTSTYYLSLPYHVGTPLMVACGLFHWLVSQSIFPAVIAEYSSKGNLVSSFMIASCGYSPLAILVTVVLAAFIFFLVIGLGFFGKFDKRARLVSNCSAAISAACHGVPWDTHAPLKELKYGAVPFSLAEQNEVRQRFVYAWAGSNSDDQKGSSEDRSNEHGPQAMGHLCLTSSEVENPQENVIYS